MNNGGRRGITNIEMNERRNETRNETSQTSFLFRKGLALLFIILPLSPIPTYLLLPSSPLPPLFPSKQLHELVVRVLHVEKQLSRFVVRELVARAHLLQLAIVTEKCQSCVGKECAFIWDMQYLPCQATSAPCPSPGSRSGAGGPCTGLSTGRTSTARLGLSQSSQA